MRRYVVVDGLDYPAVSLDPVMRCDLVSLGKQLVVEAEHLPEIVLENHHLRASEADHVFAANLSSLAKGILAASNDGVVSAAQEFVHVLQRNPAIGGQRRGFCLIRGSDPAHHRLPHKDMIPLNNCR